MEGTPFSTSSDPENSFDDKKDKRKRLESEPLDSVVSLRQSRQIAREALRHEERQESAKPLPTLRVAEVMAAPPSEQAPELSEISAETEDEHEDEDEGMDATEKQYAARALRQENRQERRTTSLDGGTPAVI